MYSIDIHSNGEPSIRSNTIAVHDALAGHGRYSSVYVTHKNGGALLVTGMKDPKAARAALADAFPGVPLRTVKAGVKVSPPKSVTARHAALYAVWQDAISRGLSHIAARNEVINAG